MDGWVSRYSHATQHAMLGPSQPNISARCTGDDESLGACGSSGGGSRRGSSGRWWCWGGCGGRQGGGCGSGGWQEGRGGGGRGGGRRGKPCATLAWMPEAAAHSSNERAELPPAASAAIGGVRGCCSRPAAAWARDAVRPSATGGDASRTSIAQARGSQGRASCRRPTALAVQARRPSVLQR